MIRRNFLVAVASMAVLAGCATNWSTNYGGLNASDTSNWRIGTVTVNVPDTLTINENDSYSPDGDIVWRREPAGDRRAQVRDIFEDSIKRGTRNMRGRQTVNLNVEVKKFHAISDIARKNLTVSGVHNITFDITVTSRSGAVIAKEADVQADLIAYSGQDAIDAEAQGQTQRVRIVNHLSGVFKNWFGHGTDMRQTFARMGR